MNYYEKYFKYKNKYLNLKFQVGGNNYAYKQYNIDDNDEIIKCDYRKDKFNNHNDIENYNNILMENFRAVFNSKKVCMIIYPTEFDKLFSKINKDKCNYNDLLVYVSSNNLITYKKTLEEDTLLILLFSDINSKNIFLKIFDDTFIFPHEHEHKKIFLYTWKTQYSKKLLDNTVYNKYINFAIFSGIIFSYDVIDIYGFIKDQIREYKLNIPFNKKIFFCRLEEIISYIKEIDSQIKKPSFEYKTLLPTNEDFKYNYTHNCQLYNYVIIIEKTNMPNSNSYNFNRITDTSSSYRYASCVKD